MMIENKRQKKTLVEIEHPLIREIEERTVHPGVEEEREQEFMFEPYDDYSERQAQG